MIEVERKFRPTKDQLESLLQGAVFVSEKEHTDTYWDKPDFSYFKQGIHLRKRNNKYELKISVASSDEHKITNYEEIENEPEILERLGFDKTDNLSDVIKNKLEFFSKIITKRKKYKKGEFIIDIDETDFGYNVVEIEVQVQDQSQVKEAEERIISLASSFGFSLAKLPGKNSEYLRIVRPEVYKQIYGEK